MNFFEKVMKVLKCRFLNIFYKKPVVMNSIETIDYILKNNCSIGRYGDGEMELIVGKNLKFQQYNYELSKRLRNIKNTKNFLVCIPAIFTKKQLNKVDIKKKEYVFWKKNLYLYEFQWRKLFNQGPYGDAFISRFYIRYNNKTQVGGYVHLFKKLWKDRNLIIVEGKTSYIGVGNDILSEAKSIRRIICPNINAFDYYKEILQEIKKEYNQGDLVLLALGPTATVLAYDLSLDNIQSLDLGHFDIEYEWFLANSDNKTPIRNKHVNECDSIGETNESDPIYYKQIVKKIG